MNSPPRRVLLAAFMLALLTGVAVWNVNWMITQRRAAQTAAADLAQCRELAAEIQALRARPAVAAVDAMGLDGQDLGARIEAAATSAQLAASEVVERITPQDAQRVPDLPYLRKPTSVTLRGVSLQQIAMFLYHLGQGSALNVRDLSLRTGPGDGNADNWSADATVTYLIYSPAKTRHEP